MKVAGIAFCAVIVIGTWPGQAATFDSQYQSSQPIRLGDSSEALLNEVPYASIEQLKSDAADLADGIVQRQTLSDVPGVFTYRPWTPPEFLPEDARTGPLQEFTRTGSLDAMQSWANRGTGVPPPPVPLKFDTKGMLGPNVAGEYVYEPNKGPVGIFLNAWMHACGPLLGDRICAEVLVHEDTHANQDLAEGLDPMQVIPPEERAFGAQRNYVINNTTPKERAWIWYNFSSKAKGFNPKAPSVPNFFTALVDQMIKLVGIPDMGDFMKGTSYRDPDENQLASSDAPDQSNPPGPNPV